MHHIEIFIILCNLKDFPDTLENTILKQILMFIISSTLDFIATYRCYNMTFSFQLLTDTETCLHRIGDFLQF